jgi:transmembrane sensor
MPLYILKRNSVLVMKYENYSAEDFFNDENFRNWILKNDPALNFFWEKWVMQNPNKKHEITIAKKLVLSLKFKDEQLTDKQKNEIWNKVQSENKQFDQSINSDSKVLPLNNGHSYKSHHKNFAYYFYRSAAAVLFLMVAWFLLKDSSTIEIAISQQIVVEKENPPGQKSKINLTDGTVVYLNASSKISYLENFETDRRLIHLTGEAYFEVARDSVRPMIVMSGSLQTKALGTKFNVNAFEDDNEFTISLLEGKVEVKDTLDNQKLILEERQAAKYNINRNKLDKVSFNLSESILWKDGILYFQKSPLHQVIAELERWYGVEIAVSGSPDNPKVVSGRFENESLANVLQGIAFSSDFDYQINGKKVLIKF